MSKKDDATHKLNFQLEALREKNLALNNNKLSSGANNMGFTPTIVNPPKINNTLNKSKIIPNLVTRVGKNLHRNLNRKQSQSDDNIIASNDNIIDLYKSSNVGILYDIIEEVDDNSDNSDYSHYSDN